MTSEDTSSSILDPFPGRLIAGNFRIQRLIGSGAMGNVYQAEQLSLGKAVAVKILHAHLTDDDKLVRRFQREAKSASRLNHPNSIQIIDSGRDPTGVLYIAMELLAGRDLSRVIREEFPLPLPRIVRIMAQVLGALDEAHAQGVIHRDLKPSNIMLIERRGEPDFVKVCDYGIAKAQMDDGYTEPQMLTIQGLVCGTPEYMSPEQARGETLDGRADLYSAAVILFQMVTGDIPFHGNTPIAIVSRHLSESPVVPSSRRPGYTLPSALDDLILRGLAKNRELRPASAALFREELENVGAGRVGRRSRSSAATLPATPVDPGQWTETAVRGELSATTAEVRRSGPMRGILVGTAAALALAATIGFLRLGGRGASSGLLPPPVAATVSGARAGNPQGPTTPVGLPVHPAPTPGRPQPEPAPVAVTASAAAALPTVAEPSPPDEPPGPQPRTGAPRKIRTGLRRDRAAAEPRPSPSAGAGKVPTTVPNTIPTETHSGSAKGGLAEAEGLLGQGDVAAACHRGEELRSANAGAPEVYRFLGKCYMRSGNSARAKENYRRYLELSPDAPDAMFIESIVK
jgi:serine/threonine-protein kinase